MVNNHRIAVVIPCFRVKSHIMAVLAGIGPEVWRVYVVDDCCPEDSGAFVKEAQCDSRVVVLRNPRNLGVGGATVTGYRQALADGATILVKMDGDGQMSGADVTALVHPIQRGVADYAKGNRFYDFRYLKSMPAIRVFGNGCLSLISKLSSGYWNLMDPTNGFTAIHARVLEALDLDKIERRYFFESDMLYRLYLVRAVIWDVPIAARYQNEISNLKISLAVIEFSFKHFWRIVARVFYTYYLRDFQLGSLLLIAGGILSSFGISFGAYHWHRSAVVGVPNTGGTVMLAALPCLIGLQLLLTFLGGDINNVPNRVIHPLLPTPPRSGVQLEPDE
ncbi:MAG: glycosyltransferase family 2 protein [Candidatus Eremiobacteraeota bacterium]|nr:glycosyltransferase family 2 protein [Candidatus Eremiobacteraeota bacterium]MCW5868973.1 glycosyltransferase family 2 protein [Candidatus Eremiobacteraeota bacterium]